jgi:hypothetical protein
LRYHRSRFFTFLFFMPTISRNSLDKYTKSCSTLHQESRKIEFAFSPFFYDFLGILEESAKSFYYWRCTFTSRTLQRTKALQPCPWFTENPQKELGACNVALGHGGGAVRPIPARPAGSRPCRGAGRRVSSPRARWCSEFGRKVTRRWRTAMAGGDGRGGLRLQRGGAMPSRWATAHASRGPRE